MLGPFRGLALIGKFWQGSILIAVLTATGCVQTRITEPKRSAVEQLLISTAADRALAGVNFSFLQGKKVFLDPVYLESEDKGYVVGTIRDLLSVNGGLLVSDRKEAEVIVEPRSGALSTDSAESLLGIPRTPVPIPLAGTFEIPEVPFFKSQRQYSVAKLALLAYDNESSRHVHSTGPMVGKASMRYYRLLGFISITLTDIPEKKGRQ